MSTSRGNLEKNNEHRWQWKVRLSGYDMIIVQEERLEGLSTKVHN
jgi:hypothetical protein